jgi:hypothetical protein
VSGDVRAELRELRAQVDGIEAKHRIGLLMAQNKRLRWALETVAFVRHKKYRAGACPGCRRIAERILEGATIEAALDGAHVPEEER